MVNWSVLGPRVTITREDGTSRVLPLERLDGGDYLDIAQSPDEGFPPPLAIGPPEQRSDVRTRQQILRDWRRGMGEDEYDETTGTTSFRYSQCDTRFKNVLVPRPKPVRLGSSTTVSNQLGGRVAYVGTGTAKWFHYGGTTAKYYSTATSQWVDSGLTTCSRHYTRGAGAHFFVHNGLANISYSTDAITWSAVSVASITAALTTTIVYGLAVHDMKLFALCYNGTNTYALMQSTNPTSGAATWTQLGTLKLDTGESPGQLFVWKFPPQPERGGLFLVTNHGIWWYDDTADAASVTAWKQWHKWDILGSSSYATPQAVAHGGTGDLYVMPHGDQDSLWQFTGSSIASHNPNKRGGLPPNKQGIIVAMATNARSIVCWFYGGQVIGASNPGMVAVFNEQEGWHHMLDLTNTAVIGVGKSMRGGGIGPTSIVTVLDDGVVWEQGFFDDSALPQYATTARVYDTTTLKHDTAKMDIGSPTIYKALLYHEMNASIIEGDFFDATVAVYYRLDSEALSEAEWSLLGTANKDTLMPWRIGFPANTKARQIELRYAMSASDLGTTIIYSAILHTTLLPPARFNTVFRVDLRDEQFRALAKTVRGYSLRSLRTFIRECHGQILSFTIHHPGDNITLARGQAAVTPIENPLTTLGRYTVQIRSLDTPASGS